MCRRHPSEAVTFFNEMEFEGFVIDSAKCCERTLLIHFRAHPKPNSIGRSTYVRNANLTRKTLVKELSELTGIAARPLGLS
jgi:pentatricopeptide repeat protein